MYQILHHGGASGVTGSCHELVYSLSDSVLIDCGLFQGGDHSEHGADSANADHLRIDFDLTKVRALCLTHAHIDHVGRIPYLLMAGYNQPIYCSEATALLLPLLLEDAVKIGLTPNRRLAKQIVDRVRTLLRPLAYNQWHRLSAGLQLRLQPAGHILGSAYLEFDLESVNKRVVFSGDLGAPYAPLLPSPRSPYRCDTLVLESTYGDRLHQGRKERRTALKKVIGHCLSDRGVVLVPAFSLGRTQELLYEFEQIIHQTGGQWDDLEIILDSPMAREVTRIYRQLKPLWDQEAQRKLAEGRHPLAFEQLTVIDDHAAHLNTIEQLKKTARPTVVIAASGMCSGGRIVNWLKALLGDPRTDVLFVGYQAQGSPGRAIQKYGDKSRYPDGYVEYSGQRYPIRAAVHSISGYSAHADQQNLVNFVKRMKQRPQDIRIVHGDDQARSALAEALRRL